MNTRSEWALRRVLEGLDFPAQRWQILAQADLNGVDAITRERIRWLPEGTYADIHRIASTLDHARR